MACVMFKNFKIFKCNGMYVLYWVSHVKYAFGV